MDSNKQRILKASLIAGLLPAIITPVLWPFVISLGKGQFPTWSMYPVAGLGISFFALVFGLIACIVLGFPSLLVLEKLNINRPFIVAVPGLLYGVMIYYVYGPMLERASFSESGPVLVFISGLGAVCAYTASYISRPGKSRRQDDSR